MNCQFFQNVSKNKVFLLFFQQMVTLWNEQRWLSAEKTLLVVYFQQEKKDGITEFIGTNFRTYLTFKKISKAMTCLWYIPHQLIILVCPSHSYHWRLQVTMKVLGQKTNPNQIWGSNSHYHFHLPIFLGSILLHTHFYLPLKSHAVFFDLIIANCFIITYNVNVLQS